MCEVVNINKEYDVYVGRPNKWGNPFTHLEKHTLAEYKVESVDEALEKYEKYLLENKELFDSLSELKYKTIACWCKTKKCHAQIIKKYVDKLEKLDERNNLLNF